MPDAFTYLVVDDDELDRLTLISEATKYACLQRVGTCRNGREALEYIRHLKPDIVFSDIEMPDMDGMEMMRTLYGTVPIPVFITSHPEFALESYDLEVFDYILKPLSAERFEKCISRIQEFFRLRQRAMAVAQPEENGYILVKQGYEKHRLHHSDILYLESMKDYTKIRTISGQSLLVLETLSSLLLQLPGDQFMRIHRSYAVNQRKVESIGTGKVMVQGVELPVGKSFKSAVGTRIS
ncbi:LytR/AlgR family response regulator transcription factor [Taibaiella koreensis]|uniref:LytR/AlgR family response regulator transcription factor n=1 Tax=Taibaiella koreensis TaxID=1268548 RepID=UPI000E59A144|nr:LytTR family DNA-binding domain-containing protein [Taibaiella koreensis]